MLPTTCLRRLQNLRLSRLSFPALFIVAAVVLGSSLTEVSAQAQYMYLDSNGDGVHTAADVITATGTTQAKIYLRTNKQRDGSDATCLSGEPLTFGSYEVCLRAVGGTVTFSNATNLQLGMGVTFGNFGTDQEYYIGYGGSGYPPGDYLLAQVGITVATGSPSIEIVSGVSINPPAFTSFGSRCEGNDYDNTIKLGTDWTDADGLAYSVGGGTAEAPVLAGVRNLAVSTGEVGSADFTATDANGDFVTLSLGNAPAFVSVAGLFSSPGSAAIRVHAFPRRGDAGAYDAVVSASDGTLRTSAPLHIEVQSGPDHAPTVRSFSPIRVVVGTVGSIRLEAADSDGDPVMFRMITGPSFAEVSTSGSGRSATTGRLILRPALCDAGTYPIEIGATSRDGEARFLVQTEILPGASLPSPAVRTFSVNPSGLASADFNEDGRADIAAVDELGTTARVFLGDGTGDLLPGWERQVDHGYFTAESADWNGDGHADLAIGAVSGAPLMVFFGLGTGAFAEPIILREVSGSNELRSADFNGDGIMDLAACDWGTEVTVILGAPGTGLGPIHRTATGASSVDLALGDYNRDGRIDFAVATTLVGEVRVFDGFGDGTFGSSRSISVGRGTYGLVAGDYNEDGILDLAAMRSYGDGQLLFMPGDATGGFSVTELGGWLSLGFETATADWNGDGHLDLLPTSEASGLRVLLGSGEGTFTPSAPIAPGEYYYDVVFADLNRDGRPDAITGPQLVSVLNTTPSTPQAMARAFGTQSQRAIPAAQSSGTMCVRLEALDGGFTPIDVDPTTLRLVSSGTGSVAEISATMTKSAVIGDSDKNSVSEYPACFAMSDASALFSLLRGKQDVPVRLEGALTDGRRFCSRFTLPIIGKGNGAIAARVEPNPLNPEGTLRFNAKTAGAVTIRLFDVNGRLVRSLWNARATVPGPQEARIDGKDASGRTLRSGVYFYQIDGAGLTETGRFTILK